MRTSEECRREAEKVECEARYVSLDVHRDMLLAQARDWRERAHLAAARCWARPLGTSPLA